MWPGLRRPGTQQRHGSGPWVTDKPAAQDLGTSACPQAPRTAQGAAGWAGERHPHHCSAGAGGPPGSTVYRTQSERSKMSFKKKEVKAERSRAGRWGPRQERRPQQKPREDGTPRLSSSEGCAPCVANTCPAHPHTHTPSHVRTRNEGRPGPQGHTAHTGPGCFPALARDGVRTVGCCSWGGGGDGKESRSKTVRALG